MSPIGFGSRPSSRPGSPNDTLSGYFSGLNTKGSKSTHNSLGSMILNTSLLQDQQLRGVRAWERKRELESRGERRQVFNTVCGKATVSTKWR
ncbi:hypothetical protein TrRE_jg5920 [Triparma retinervis]|uniref:Uncharacterized protein n=1 Tax=Triparma retinervis TaxID=2557542 RepID=A0A9W7FDQ9_9STRA|nr:hypothetical protein TrRE_jg5920 [Triparma retinervis]